MIYKQIEIHGKDDHKKKVFSVIVCLSLLNLRTANENLSLPFFESYHLARNKTSRKNLISNKNVE